MFVLLQVSHVYGGPEVQDTTAFHKTPQHFTKHHSISQNTTAFQKTQQHFRKHYSISENTTAFQKTPQHFTLDRKGIPLGRTLLVCDWTEPAREALL